MSEDRPVVQTPSAYNTDEVARLLQRFAEDSTRCFEASVDDLVRVRVGSTMNITNVDLLDKSLDPALRERLELALVSAVNLALQKSALAAGNLFGDFERQLKEQKRSR